jgi:hypothetical protein
MMTRFRVLESKEGFCLVCSVSMSARVMTGCKRIEKEKGDVTFMTIAQIGIESHDPTAPSDGRRTSIFGRLGTRRLGTVIYTISSVD